jgi:UDP-N-acetylglucosamine acyltransferase
MMMERATDHTPAPAAPQVHPTAIVDPDVELGAGVEVGPYAIIGPNVSVGENTTIGPHAFIEKNTKLGAECVVSKGAVLGTAPQDLKYEGEDTRLIVGDGTTIREFATLNRGTRAAGQTVVGNGCLLMAYAHIAHDCVIGNRVIIANAVQMGGHVMIDDCATIGGLVALHQFVRVGAYAFIGGASRVPKDVAPYVRAAGNPLELYGLNTVGLERRGFSKSARLELKRAYRILFKSELNISQAVAELRALEDVTPEVEHLIDFIEASERGVSV